MTYFNIKNIEIEIIEKFDSISSYNDNYYKIKPCENDYYDFYGNDILRIKSYDDEYEESSICICYVGKIIDGTFIPAFMTICDTGECI